MIDNEDQLFKAAATRLQGSEESLYLKLTDPSTKPPYRIISRPLVNFRTGMKVTAKNQRTL